MKVLVAYSSFNGNARALAEKIAEGAREATAEAEVVDVAKKALDLSQYEFVFLGCDILFSFDSRLLPAANSKSFGGVRTAVFAARGRHGEKGVTDAVSRIIAGGGSVRSTFFVQTKGVLSWIGFGRISDEDAIRARGFGERTVNNALGIQVRKDSEKSRIMGYIK